MLEGSNDVGNIIRESERNYYEADEDGNDAKIKSALDHYKTFFEASFRHWGTIPYFYSIKMLGVKSQAKNPDSFLGVSSGIKFKTLSERVVDLGHGKLSELVSDLSSDLRNAGGGHDSYEYIDNHKVKLKIFNPHSGKLEKEMTTSFPEIKDKINEARKTIWILRNGLMIYLNKNPNVLQQVARNKPLKLREIKAHLEELAEEKQLELIDFSYDTKLGVLSLSFEKRKMFSGKSTEILFGSGERFDVITISTEVKLIELLLGILHVASYLMKDGYLLKSLMLKFVDQEDVFVSSYSAKDLLQTKNKKVLLKPETGETPGGSIEILSEVTVPFGSRLFFVRKLTEMGYKVID
jgi:hypothetical protein